jgi:hypothetical protein
MLIYDVLKMDHRMVLGIIDTIEMISEPARRKDMLSLMRVELNMHAHSEEEAFYAPLAARMADLKPASGDTGAPILPGTNLDDAFLATPQMIDTAEDEHHQVEKQLMKLQMGGGATEDWLSDLRDLRAMLQRHILKEETDVFHLAQTLFTTTEAADMAARFLEGKGRLGMENPLSLAAHAVKDLLT